MASKTTKTADAFDALPSKKPKRKAPVPVASGKKDFYGIPFNAQLPVWAPELYIFSRYDQIVARGMGGGLLPKHEHFINAARLFWPNSKSCSAPFIWHPWAEDMLVACCYNKYVAFAGSASCGKSRFLAVWLLGNYISWPTETLCLATSTTIRDSKKRIWGAIQAHYAPVKAIMPYAKMVDSPTPAIYHLQDGQRLDTAGVHLIPAEAKKTNEVTGKMRGMKANSPTGNGRVFLAADELTELSPAVVTTALSNLVNNPTFHLAGAANPSTFYDAFALIAEPKTGWSSISVDDERWETKVGGVCLHFDALKNPNYIARENIWPVQEWEKVDEAVKTMSNKPEFWRDFRAFWCPEGVDNYVFTGQDIINSRSDQKAVWEGPKKRVAGFDPSFTSGGDRGMLTIGWVGVTIDRILTVEFDKCFHLSEDPNDKSTGRSFQIAEQIQQKLEEFHVPIHHLGVDSTGGGSPFCDVLSNVLGSNDFLRVSFNGKASDLPVSSYDSTPSHQKYANRVTEIWFYGSELMRAGQLRGIPSELAQEMTTRTYDTRRDAGTRMFIEPKPLMKARLGYSPDLADSYFVMLQVARERLGFTSAEKVPASDRGGYTADWRSEMRRFSPRKSYSLCST